MMNRRFLICALLALSMFNLTGCKKEPMTGEPMTLRVMGVRGMNDFPQNMQFGLFADSPVNADNVPFSVLQNFQTVFDDTPLWGFDQTYASRLLVYSPYNPAFTGHDESVVDVPLDQSTVGQFLSANFMIGTASGKPGQSNLIVQMEHAMTAMMLKFDNRTGDKLESCTVSGFMTQGIFNKVTGTLTADGKNRMVTPLRSLNGDDVFCFLYFPQEGTPTLYLTFESGREVTMTFSSYFHEYPGRVISPGVITLEKDIQKVCIIPLEGVSLSEWSNNNIPYFPLMSPYFNLKSLVDVATDSAESGHFIANVNKFYVTAVDENKTSSQGVILEDSTRAIYAWMYPGHKVSAGESYVGRIEGLMEKNEDATDYCIMKLYLTNATWGKEKTLPCTEGNFTDLADGVGEYEYRRMSFKDVTVKQSFEKGNAVFCQNGVDMPVLCEDVTVFPSAGSKGDIIGFPVTVAGRPAIRLFDGSQLEGLIIDYESDAFTRAERLGKYDLTPYDTVMIDWNYPGSSQTAIHSNGYDRSLQISDFTDGRFSYCYVYSSNEDITKGHEYVVAFHEWGQTNDSGETLRMECIKVENGKAWLRDSAGKTGLIIAI